MLSYYLKMAYKSILSTPRITLISVFAIGLGVAVATSIATIHHVFSRNPIPEKSDVLYNVRLDTWDPNSAFFGVGPDDPPKAVTWRDMTGLMKEDISLRKTGVGNGLGYVFPENRDLKPWQTTIRLVHADFFTMFMVPFKYGTGWSSQEDKELDLVVVLSEECNDKLFGGQDSVGKWVRIGSREYRVCGVLDTFDPTPMYYDPVNGISGPPREFFIPLDHVLDQTSGIQITGNTDGWGNFSGLDGREIITVAEYNWIQYWVELEPGKAQDYREYMSGYVSELKKTGRHPRDENNHVTPIMDWVTDRLGTVSNVTASMSIISYLFLLVCAINLMGLLLGKFLSRSSRIGVHRALGASRSSIFLQHIMECEMVGVMGGAMGLLLTIPVLKGISSMLPNIPGALDPSVFRLDGQMVVLSVLLALGAGLISGLYPAWRACRISPAIQLKL